MRNYFIFLLLTVLLSSCMTVKRIQRNCDAFAKVCVAETQTWTVYRDTVIYRTDTISVQLPPDTVTITDTVRIVNHVAYLAPIHRRFGLVSATAGVSNSVLSVKAWLADSTILVPRKDTIYIENAIVEETTTNTVPVRYIPKAYKYAFWIVIIQIITILSFVGLRLATYYGVNLRTILRAVLSRNGK